MKALLNFFLIIIFMIELSNQNDNLMDTFPSSDKNSDSEITDMITTDIIAPTPNASNTSNSTIPPITSREVILLGFDNFNKVNSTFFTFNTNLKRIDTNFSITKIKFPITIFYKDRLRFLDEDTQNVDCDCDDDKKENVECNCKGRSDGNKNISRILLVEDFEIDGVKRNLTLSSLAKNQRDKIDKQKEDIFNPNDSIEIMTISKLNDLSSSFTLKGKSEKIPTSSEFTLIATKFNNQKEFLCHKYLDSDGYVLDCENPSIVNNLDLNNTLAKANGNEKLIIQFPSDVQSKIGTTSSGYYNINSRKKKGLSTGGIIAIIIPSIIVLLGALALAFMLKGNQNPEPQLINNNTVGITSSTNINEKNII